MKCIATLSLFTCLLHSSDEQAAEHIYHEMIVKNYTHLQQGFDLVSDNNQFDILFPHQAASLQDLMKQSLSENADQGLFTDIVQTIEDVIALQCKDRFLTALQAVVATSDKTMMHETDPVIRYIMKYHDTMLRPIVRNWLASQPCQDVPFLSQAVEHNNIETVKMLLAIGCNHIVRSNYYHEVAYRRHYLNLCQLRINKQWPNWLHEAFYKSDKDLFKQEIDTVFYNYAFIHHGNKLKNLAIKKRFGMIKIALQIEEETAHNGYVGHGKSQELLPCGQGTNYLLKKDFSHYCQCSDTYSYNKSLKHCYEFGVTPLHQAVLNNSLEIIQMLLEDGVDVNSKDILDVTPLHVAVEYSHVDAVGLLLHAGADVHAKNILGKTPLHLAIEYSNRGDKFFCGNNIAISHMLIAHPGIDVEQKVDPISISIAFILSQRTGSIFEETGKTPLFLALESKSIEIVQKLLELGANPHSKNDKSDRINGDRSDNLTDLPLHYAVRYCSKEYIDLLLHAGADITMQDCHGKTPLHYAYSDNEKWLQLMHYNPNLELKDNEGNTAEKLRIEWMFDNARYQARQRVSKPAKRCMIS